MRRSEEDCYSKMRNVPISTRLDTIEEKLAHLERAVHELNDVVTRQQKELDRALERNQRLMEKLAALESDYGTNATAHEKPPHY
jgi:SlyX protein